MKRSGFIYGLRLKGGVIRYVGQSANPSRRFEQHTNPDEFGDKLTLVQSWASRHVGCVEYFILEETDDMDKAERKWIAKYRAERLPLFNIVEGGSHVKTDVPAIFKKKHALLDRWKQCDPQPEPEDFSALRADIRAMRKRCKFLVKKKKKKKKPRSSIRGCKLPSVGLPDDVIAQIRKQRGWDKEPTENRGVGPEKRIRQKPHSERAQEENRRKEKEAKQDRAGLRIDTSIPGLRLVVRK